MKPLILTRCWIVGVLLSALAGCSSPATEELRWGADASGGEPYLVERPGEEPDGFEGELVAYLGEKLGRPTKFVQGDWDGLPQFLQRGDVEMILNGYEWSSEREKAMASTIPYYVYHLRLIVHKDSPIRTWDDLKKPGLRIGVLRDTAAHRYLMENVPEGNIEALGAEGTTTVLTRVSNRQMDATVQDDCLVPWYLERKKLFPNLHAVGEPLAPSANNYYVIFVRRGDEALRERLNTAIREGLRDGTLRRIYERYGLWNSAQERLLEVSNHWPPAEAGITPSLDWFVWQLAQAALTTVLLSVTAMPLAMTVGLFIALGRLYGPRWLGIPLAVYVEATRGTPVLFQLMTLYFGLPLLGINLSPFWAGVIGLGMNYAAYEAENYRAGLLAVPIGQMEAALALGMSRTTALRRIIAPQAIRLVIPPVTNDFISLFKDTSVCSAIAVTELLARYRTLTVNFPQLALWTLLITACLYLLMSYPLSLLARYMEQHQEDEEDDPA